MISKTVEMVIGGKAAPELVVVPASATVAEAVALMARKGIGAILILGADGLVGGIFTERDLMVRVVDEDRDPGSTPIAEVMSPNVRRVAPSASVEEALRLMVEHGYRHLLVEEGAEVRGLISIRDLMAALILPDAPMAHEGRYGHIQVRAKETVRALAEGRTRG
jgi:CBS domain-containing protein